MKPLILLLMVACLQAPARGFGQTVSLSLNNAHLEKAFTEIKKQTGYSFVYTRAQLKNTLPVSCDLKNVELKEALDRCFRDQPLTYVVEGHYVVVQSKPAAAQPQTAESEAKTINGRVITESGEALAGVSVITKKANKGTATNELGEFSLSGVSDSDVLVISSVGYYKEEVPVGTQSFFLIRLRMAVSNLDETIVMAYGKTSRRFNTGSISKVSSTELERQPVTNPLLALEGRVPGLTITQSSGLNGAAVKVQLRGQNSILQGSDPLYIIDGIPFAGGNKRLNQIDNATDEIGMSPFNLVNLDNIESIEILKDADATAIYGSRGANGVIIITTKKGTPGKTKLSADLNSGFSKVTRTMNLLNTRQYIQMRREAFANDGLLPSADPSDAGYAPDILVWDSTRYTDLKKLLIGGRAHTTNARISLSGGTGNTQFLMGAAYQRQTTVFPTSLGDTKASANFSLNHQSTDKKLALRLQANYISDVNDLNTTDLTSFINLPPNIKLYDEAGKINWQENNVPFNSVLFRQNPLAVLKTMYDGRFKNLISNIEIEYKILEGLNARVNLGYNTLQANERSAEPSTSIDPNSGDLPSANFASRIQSSWIAEPQIEYRKVRKFGTFTVLAGSTWQENRTDGIFTQAFNYSNDLLLGSVNGAGIVRTNNNFGQYRYTALFGRVTYNFKDRYILNLSGRRDGSSRFGPAHRFSNFGALGGAWIFVKESADLRKKQFISFGKIRSSYGVTGNDQIGDYKYLDTWAASSNTYQGIPVTNPSALFNPDFSWERNRKMEIALDIGVLKNRIFLSGAYYRNRSNNQLINYTLPIQTGFNSVLKNLNALLENKGAEFEITTKNITSKNITWTTSINFTANRNKILAFPGLSSSSYSNTYFTGYSVSTRKLYHYLGVDPATGLYMFQDVDGNGTLDNNDRVSYVNTDPKFFGGISNSFQYKKLLITIFFEYIKQKGYDYLSNNNAIFTPGYGLVNQPVIVLNRWQKPGDKSAVQKFTASSASDAFSNMNDYLPLSDANISDASFIRCKNISASYEIPSGISNSLRLEKCVVYLYAQNLFVITKYKGADPETQNMFVLPPLKTIVAGLRITF
jgi:TonB-linked SusC/RagA family outer membrane protein